MFAVSHRAGARRPSHSCNETGKVMRKFLTSCPGNTRPKFGPQSFRRSEGWVAQAEYIELVS